MASKDIETVLLIDDEPDIRTIAEIALSSVGGWRVFTAASGPEGIALARAEKPDLILLDVMMPEMDGPTTLSNLQALPETRSIPVLFMTAKAQAHELATYRTLGAVGVVVKPFDPMTLADQVRAASADS